LGLQREEGEEEEEEEKEEEEEEEEEVTATAFDGNQVSHENFDMDACNLSKQGLEPEIAPETQNDPESEVTDGCDPSKSALDKNVVSHKNFHMDANDQSKQRSEPEIGTENQNGPESEVTDGSDTSINVPGDKIATVVTSPGEGGSDDESDGSTVLPSNPPSQCLYHDIFTRYLHHFLQNNLHLLKDIIQDIIIT
jgi:hypothetical protein